MTMREQKLTREEALQQYLIYGIRLREYIRMFRILEDIMYGCYNPADLLGSTREHFSDTVRTAVTGLFASLMDRTSHALNVFDVWLSLFPARETKITDTWKKIEPYIQIIRDYRNDVSCHANKDLRRYVHTRQKFKDELTNIVSAMQEFMDLAKELRPDEAKLRPELDSTVGKLFPERDARGRESLLDSVAGPWQEKSETKRESAKDE
jgi:hypothetical protein